VVACLDQLSAETGVAIDSALVATRLGPPLEIELAHWFKAAAVPAAADRFRELYPDLAVPVTTALPGAHEAIDVVRRSGGRAVVITAKWEVTARLTLDHLGLTVVDVVGWRWGTQKTETLRDVGAWCYVGDHVSDVDAARRAGVVAVAVPSGPCSRAQLSRFRSTVVLGSLTEFPDWYAGAAGQRMPSSTAPGHAYPAP